MFTILFLSQRLAGPRHAVPQLLANFLDEGKAQNNMNALNCNAMANEGNKPRVRALTLATFSNVVLHT
jgi:hypothetical protein